MRCFFCWDFVVFTVADELFNQQILRTNGKLVSFSMAPISSVSSTSFTIILGFSNNHIEKWTLNTEQLTCDQDSTIELPGHRSDIRDISLSSDDSLIATSSNSNNKYLLFKCFFLFCSLTLTCSLSQICSRFGTPKRRIASELSILDMGFVLFLFLAIDMFENIFDFCVVLSALYQILILGSWCWFKNSWCLVRKAEIWSFMTWLLQLAFKLLKLILLQFGQWIWPVIRVDLQRVVQIKVIKLPFSPTVRRYFFFGVFFFLNLFFFRNLRYQILGFRTR